MDEYIKDVKEVPQREVGDRKALVPVEKQHLASAGGQLNWAARQACYHLQAGISRCQQLSGLDDPDALREMNAVIRRSREPMIVVIRKLRCPLQEMLVLAVSDAAYGGMPGGASQGGLIIAMAEPSILRGTARLSMVDVSSSKIQRVVRASMGAELSNAATAYEHGDYVRAVLSEMTNPEFKLKQWRKGASTWKQVLVIDAKCGYDSLNSDLMPSDRRTAIGVAVLRESLDGTGKQQFCAMGSRQRNAV